MSRKLGVLNGASGQLATTRITNLRNPSTLSTIPMKRPTFGRRNFQRALSMSALCLLLLTSSVISTITEVLRTARPGWLLQIRLSATYTSVGNIRGPRRRESNTSIDKGMSGMVPRNLGATGTYLPDALYQNLECRHSIGLVPWEMAHFLAGRVIQTFALLTIGSAETRQNDTLNHGMQG